VGTEKVWQYIEDFNLPRLVVVNKLDRENADFEGALAQLQEHFGPRVVPVQLPIGKEEQFKGLVDLIDEKALLFSGDGKKVEVQEIPEDLRDKAAAMREKLIEAAAEMEDELLLSTWRAKPWSGRRSSRRCAAAFGAQDLPGALRRRREELRQWAAPRFYQELHAFAA